MGQSTSKFQSFKLSSYAANPLVIIDSGDHISPDRNTRLHIRQSGSFINTPGPSLIVYDELGEIQYHLDGPPHYLFPSTSTFRNNEEQFDDLILHMTNVYGHSILKIIPKFSSSPLMFTNNESNSTTLIDISPSTSSSSISTSHTLSSSTPPYHLSSQKHNHFPTFCIHQTIPKSPSMGKFFHLNRLSQMENGWDIQSRNSFDALFTQSSSGSTLTPTKFMDPTLCLQVKVTKLNLNSHSITLTAQSAMGKLVVKAAIDAPITYVFSGHPSHGGLLIARSISIPQLDRLNLHKSLLDICTIDIAPGVDRCAIIALCIISETIRFNLDPPPSLMNNHNGYLKPRRSFSSFNKPVADDAGPSLVPIASTPVLKTIAQQQATVFQKSFNSLPKNHKFPSNKSA